MPSLYLIDGYAQFFRAYHAIRTPMTSPVTKEPTNMTFGFIGMMLKLLRGEGPAMSAWGGKPDYVAVALDVSGDRGTFRSEIDPEYKANRPPPPEDLLPQVERCLAILRELGVPTIGAEGFEADDVMATLITRLREDHPDLAIRMISKDKDLKQLLETSRDANDLQALGGRVELFDIHTDLAFGVGELARDTGLKPSQVVDMLSLMGDTVDNVPGVEGVGEKTAAQLVRDFGSLDVLIDRVAEIKGKRGEKIREAIPLLATSRKLVTLRRDVPVEFDLASARSTALKLDRLIPVLKELGFNRYQDEVRALMGSTPECISPPDIHAARVQGSSSLRANSESGASIKAATNVIVSKPKPRNESSYGTLFGLANDDPASAANQDRSSLAASGPQGDYRCITTMPQLDELVTRLRAASMIAIDTETTGVRPMVDVLCGISLSDASGTGFYIPVRSPTPDKHLDEATVIETLRPVLQSRSILKCGHNVKFDLLIFRRAGVEVQGIAFDSMVASYLIDSSRSSHGLEALSLALLNNPKNSISELIGTGKQQRSFETVPIHDATPYAAADADLALQLRNVMDPQLRTMGLGDLFDRIEMPLVEVLADLEWNGVLVDGRELDRQRARLQDKIDEILKKLHAESLQSIARKFDPDSPKQLAAALFNKPDDDDLPGLGLKPLKKTKTGNSTDAEVLETIAEDATISTPIPKLILEYRQLTKLVSTYLLALKDEINARTGRVHTSFNQTVAATGRLASSDPNLQNIPIRTDIGREIRKAFIAPEGCVLVTADYSQIELRLLAHLSRDPALIEAFLSDQDIHTQVAAQIHGVTLDQVTREQRSGAKMVNFGIVYGITSFGLARRLGIENDAAADIIKGYKRRFSGITTFLEECVDQARRFGYVETILKRRRPIPDIESSNPSRRAFAERTAINSVVQGSAADLIKLAMVNLSPAQAVTDASPSKPNTIASIPSLKMLLQIHDELVFECQAQHRDAAMKLIRRGMEDAMELKVPLKVDVHAGTNWYEGKS